MRTIDDVIADSFSRHRLSFLNELAALIRAQLDTVQRELADVIEDEIEARVTDEVADLRQQIEQGD
jgi:hypothetical protein